MRLSKKQISMLEKNGSFEVNFNTMTNQFGDQIAMYKNTMVVNNKKSRKLQLINQDGSQLNYIEAIKIAKIYIKNENDIIKIEGWFGDFTITYHHNLNLDI